MSPPVRHTEESGARIAYQVVGEGPAELVYVPGLFSHLQLQWTDPAFARFARRLSSFARVCFYDKRGTGLSETPETPPTLDERLDDLKAVLNAAGMQRPSLFGFSGDGARLAAVFAATWPHRVDRLVLYGSSTGGEAGGANPYALPQEVWRIFVDAVENWGSGRTLPLLAPSIDNEVQRALWGFVERSSVSAELMRLLLRDNRVGDITPLLPAVSAPTLVMHRTQDPIPIEGARHIARMLRDARFVELPGRDHIAWVGGSEHVLSEVEAFLGRSAVEPATRVLASLLFTDIVDSTRLLGEMGDERWRVMLGRHDEIVREELVRHRGREVDTTGDGFFAYFDGPVRAARCATSILARLEHEQGLLARAGVHVGECDVHGLRLQGMAVHLAARICAQAAPGQVAVSEPVARFMTGSGLRVVSLGARPLKGIAVPQELFALSSEPTAEREGGTGTYQRMPQPWRDRLQLEAARRLPALARTAVRLTRPSQREPASSP